MADHHPVDPKGIRCPRCNKAYDFWTKEGRLIGPFHPMGECKAPVIRLVKAECEVCGEEVSEQRPGYGKERTCSTECRKILDERERALRRKISLARADKRRAEKEAARQASIEWFAGYKERKEQQALQPKRQRRA